MILYTKICKKCEHLGFYNVMLSVSKIHQKMFSFNFINHISMNIKFKYRHFFHYYL